MFFHRRICSARIRFSPVQLIRETSDVSSLLRFLRGVLLFTARAETHYCLTEQRWDVRLVRERGEIDEVTQERIETREVMARKEPLQALVSDLALAEEWLQVGVAASRSSLGAHLGAREPQREARRAGEFYP